MRKLKKKKKREKWRERKGMMKFGFNRREFV